MAFGFTELDDRDLIVDDQAFLARWSSVFRAFTRAYMHAVDPQHPYYRPLVVVSYVIDAQWSGTRPFGYHATNVLVHVLASVLCFALFLRLDFGRLVACLGALVFAVHPWLVCAVAWIPGRNDSLLAVFVFAAWLAFLSDARRPRSVARIGHVTLFGLALLTKETATVLPLVFGAHLVMVEGRRARLVHRPRALVSVVVGWAGCLGARFGVRGMGGGSPLCAMASEIGHHARLLPAGLGEIIFPIRPALIGVVDDAPVGLGLLAMALVLLFTWSIPGVRRPVVLFGGVAFGLWSLPALAVPGTLVCHHRLYLPACGVLIMVAEIVRAVSVERRVVLAFGGVTVLASCAVALGTASTFRDGRAFALASVDAAPRSPLAHVCMGRMYQARGDGERALSEYQTAVDLGAIDVVHNNMAVIYMANARWAEAEREIREELAVDPRYARAFANLAIVLRHEGRPDDARAADGVARGLERDE
jgi:protein O-mannosyl-transferase